MFLLLDSKIGDQESNKWLTALIDDHISNLEKKMEDYFATYEPFSAWIQQPFIAELNGNERLNFHEQHLELQNSQAAKTKFSSFSLIELWCSMLREYPLFYILICQIYPPFTRKRIVSLCFGRYVRPRLGIAISELSKPPVFHIRVGRPVKCLAQGHNKRTCRLTLHNLAYIPSAKQGSCAYHFLTTSLRESAITTQRFCDMRTESGYSRKFFLTWCRKAFIVAYSTC